MRGSNPKNNARRGFFTSQFRGLPIKKLSEKVDWERWSIQRVNRKEIGNAVHEVWSETEDFVRGRSKQINPTLAIQTALTFFWFVLLCAAFGLHQFHPVTLIPIFLLQSLVVFLMFTPLHDAVHFVAHRKKVKNELMLWACWPIFLGSPLIFRRVHISHHARTNHGEMDPDHFTSGDKVWWQFIKSFGLIFYYHFYAIKHFRSLEWRAHLTASMAIPLILAYAAIVTPFTWSIVLGMLLPSFFGIGLLAFVNTAWPHRPGAETSKYRNTKNTYVPWFVQILLLNQNLHQVHHIKPNLPWYQYPEYWREHKEEIIKSGATVTVLTDRDEPYSLVPERLGRAYRQLREAIESSIKGY